MLNSSAIKCSQLKIVKSNLKFHSRFAFFQLKPNTHDRGITQTIREGRDSGCSMTARETGGGDVTVRSSGPPPPPSPLLSSANSPNNI